MDERDNVRIDILKVRQKIFSQYPPGSEEHKAFLKSVKSAELGHLSSTLPPELVNFVMEAAKLIMKHEVKEILKFAIPTAFCGLVNYFFATTIVEHVLMLVCTLYFAFHCVRHLSHLALQLKDLRDLKDNYSKLRNHMQKLSQDLKRLEGPGDRSN
jgi:hypothetical protein